MFHIDYSMALFLTWVVRLVVAASVMAYMATTGDVAKCITIPDLLKEIIR